MLVVVANTLKLKKNIQLRKMYNYAGYACTRLMDTLIIQHDRGRQLLGNGLLACKWGEMCIDLVDGCRGCYCYAVVVKCRPQAITPFQ